MPKAFRKVAVVSRPGFEPARKFAEQAAKQLKSLGLDVQHSDGQPSDLVSGVFDLVVVVGGDGTILTAARQLDTRTAILSVALGGRGILGALKPEDAENGFRLLKEGRFLVEKRMRLHVSTDDASFPPALNEVYIVRKEYNVTPTFQIYSGQKFSLAQRMDGVMVSTPTGSTGHSYSLGAPVVAENLDAVLLTPVCSVAGLHPIVLPPVELCISSNQPCMIVVDGQGVFEAKAGAILRVTRHIQDATFVKFSDKELRQLANLGFT